MAENWKTIEPERLGENFIRLTNKDWMLITAGQIGNWNTMTASWGCFGYLWQRPVAVCFVRPTRHTFDFINRSQYYTLSFFTEAHRGILDYCGSHSGRDSDKAAATGLLPVDLGGRSVGFEQARLVFECRKLYSQDFDPVLFADPGIERLYPEKDYHRAYYGEIVRCLSV